MPGTRNDILTMIEREVKRVDGPNVIWIRGFPGVGKSALAASIAIRLQEQHRHVIWFRFDRTQSTTITTDALWRAIAYDLARLHPSLRKHLIQGSRELISSDMDQLFKLLIETPLSMLKNVPLEELPVIVIDALDECGGLRHDSSEKRDHSGLLRTLQRWVKVDHLKRFKLVITSRKENRITKIFPEPISVHINIPSGNDVKPGDNASEDIRIFLKSRLESMGLKVALIEKALESLVPRAAGIFIWVTTVANFLEPDPEGRFAMLENDDGKGLKGLDSLYSLYSTIVKASFGHGLIEEEIRAVVSIMGAMIFAKEPLDDNALIMLPKVKIPGLDVDRLGFIRQGLMSVIDSDPVLRFHHRSFEDFLLSPSFLQQHSELSDVQDRVNHERQLAVLCLKTLVSSKLHFNMCSLKSSIVKNVDIQASVRSAIPPLVSYSCQYWADHLAHALSDKTSIEAVKFVMYEKLLFWMEAMSLLGKAYEVALILRRVLSWKVCLKFISFNAFLMLAGQTLDPDHEVTLFIRDALRFIPAFIIPISQCPPHIYVSALSFAPKQSLIAKKFCSRFPNTVVVSEGRPSQWPMVIFTAEHHKNHVRRLVFSPNERTFASISTLNDICVCDSETGHCISGPFELRYDESVYDAHFSPDGNHILLEFNTYAVVLDIEMGEEQFRIEGRDFAFIQDGRRIASTHWIDEDGNSISWGNLGFEGVWPTRILVKIWDASKGVLTCDRLFEVNDVAHTRFSPDGRFLAVGRKSESIIELWNLEDRKDPRRFSYPPGDLLSFVFSPTSDSFMAVSREKDIYLWRLHTQEMISFSHDFRRSSHVIHSPLTNYLFVERNYTVEIWDVSMTGSKLIWEAEPPTTSRISSTCPSQDGHRLLVGCRDGSVKMRELDLENLAMNRADTMDTQADTDVAQFVAFSHSGKMVATKSKRSDIIELLDTTTGQVVLRMNFADDMEIAFSLDEDQAAFWSRSIITVCDIMDPDNCVSFNPWPRQDIRIRKVAFQTCNDLVIYASSDDSASLQVWHRQDPSGLKCACSLDLKVKEESYLLPSPDGLTFVITSSSSHTTCYSWDHDAAQFHPVDFDDQVHIHRPKYSPDGKIFVSWSRGDSYVRVWDTQTGRLVSKFQTSEVDAMAPSPTLIKNTPGERLIALWFKSENTTHVLDVYTGRLYAKIWGQGSADMAFIQDGTNLAIYSPDFGLRIWDIVDLTDEHWNSAHGYEPILQGMTDGWVVGRDNKPLFWVPVEHRVNLYVPSPRVVLGITRKKATSMDLSDSRLWRKWMECIDKEWLRGLERKGKEIGSLLEKYVLSSVQAL